MSKFIARQNNVAIGRETTRGTEATSVIWLPKMSFKHDDKVQRVEDESSVGVIEDSIGGAVTQKYAEGELGGRVDAESIGLLFYLLFGSASSGAVSGQAGAYDHSFNVLESAQHPTFTMKTKDPNTGNGFIYTLGALQEFALSAEINKFLEYKAKYRANSKTVSGASLSPSYSTTQTTFLPQHINAKFATNYAGLAGASNIEVKKVELSVKKNIEDDQVLGNLSAVDRLNKQFVVEGSLEIIANDYSYLDTLLNGDDKAFQLDIVNTSKTIGVSTNPSITLTLYKSNLIEVANTMDNNGFIKQALKFKAYYSLADAKMIAGAVRNTTTSY